MIEELNNEIAVSRDLLDTLPQNNIKNRQKYKNALEENKKKYDSLIQDIIKEINKRVNKYSKVNEDETINETKIKIDNIKENLYLLNNYNTSYEKFNLDKILYELDHFYKEDLDKVNLLIYECISIFKKAGIELTKNDFTYSEYAYKYMEVLLEKNKAENRIKQVFEELYWQCSDIIKHIELNIKYLYYKNQSIFEKYALTTKNEFVKSFKKDVLETYDELVATYDFHKSHSLYIGLHKFIDKDLNINEYQKSKIENSYQIFIDEYKDNLEYVNEEIDKLSLSCIEYKNYLSFNYIIEDLKRIYQNKEKFKNVLKSKLKLIQKKEKTLISLNKKNKAKKEKIKIKITNLIKELETLYKELDEDIFNDRVYKYLTDDSTIYEALCLACSHYSYIVKCIKQEQKDVSFKQEYNDLIDFLLSPYNNIIDNIAITEEKDLPQIISNRYKLSNFKITEENLSTVDNIDEMIATAKKIDIYNNIVLKLQYDNIKFLVDAKDLIKK